MPTMAFRSAGLITTVISFVMPILPRPTTPIRFGPKRKRNTVCCHCYRTTGAAAARIDRQVIWAPRLATASAIALAIVVASHVSPLAQCRLTKQHRARLAQLLHYMSISRYDTAEQSPGACRCLHSICRCDVVFDKKWYTVERTAYGTTCALSIQVSSD